MENSQGPHEIKYAALALVAILFLSISSVVFPILFLIAAFLPVPLMIVFHSIKRQTYYLLILTTFISFFIIFGILYGIIIGVYTCGLGTIYGYLTFKRFSAFQVVKNGSIGIVLFFTILFAFMETFYDISFVRELELVLEETVDVQVEYLREINAPSSQIEEVKEFPELYSNYIIPLTPGILVISSTIFSFLQYVVGLKFIQKIGGKIESFPPFKFWKLPGYFAFIFIISVLAMFFVGDNDTIVGMFFLNLFYLLTYGLLIQGVAFIYWFLREKNINKIISVLGILLLLAIPPLSFIILFGGVFELAFNFRKI